MQQLSAILAKRQSKSTKSIESIVVRAKSSESSKGRRVDKVDRVDRWPSQVDRMHSTRSTARYSGPILSGTMVPFGLLLLVSIECSLVVYYDLICLIVVCEMTVTLLCCNVLWCQ